MITMESRKIKLIKKESVQDAIGVTRAVETSKAVYAEIKSSGQNEFFKAAQSGLKSALQVRMWNFEYSGEKEVEIDGIRYSVYRTFDASESGIIELYLERRCGNG